MKQRKKVMNRKLIFLDIDGTLTMPGNNIPPDSAVVAIKKAQAQGHLVFLCTGRNRAMLSPLLRYGFDGAIALDGGYVTIGDEVIFDCPMTDVQRDLALDVFKRHGVFRTIEAKDASYGDEHVDEDYDDLTIESWREELATDLGILPMSAYDGRAIYKIVIMCQKEKQLEEARDLLGHDFVLTMEKVAAHHCLNGELVNRQFDKGQGILKICEKLGADISDTYGFGDSLNDQKMMDKVGIGIAMANGSASLKKMADVIAPAVSDDGLYQAFKELKLF